MASVSEHKLSNIGNNRFLLHHSANILHCSLHCEQMNECKLHARETSIGL